MPKSRIGKSHRMASANHSTAPIRSQASMAHEICAERTVGPFSSINRRGCKRGEGEGEQQDSIAVIKALDGRDRVAWHV